ncbi:hypothetical protein BCR42DRAFT_417158 [Absidia repens]|uniref:GAR domain-containing protein n=1 Tax=Absidia repens TaxID=90262 RepID=A0A1X2IDF2_9FUNG|nr:hypothetical protein BCR42DRAFT_417158 [Absidia repens]
MISDSSSHPSSYSSLSISSGRQQHSHSNTNITTLTSTTSGGGTPATTIGEGCWEDGLKSLDSYSAGSASQASELALLHPLQAAQEDVALYESNLVAMRTQLALITDGMKWVQQNDPRQQEQQQQQQLVTPSDPQHHVAQQHQVARLSQIDQAYNTLQYRMNQAEHQFTAFRQGFDFSQACHAIRFALDTVQANMMQQRTMMTANHHHAIVQAWEESIMQTTQQLADIRLDYADYFLPTSPSSQPQQQDEGNDDHDNDDDEVETKHEQHRVYEKRWETMHAKNELVRSWVEEVRVWFAEAERIRQWIDERRDQLEETTLPDPMAPLIQDDGDDHDGAVVDGIVAPGLEMVKHWQEQQQQLENDMDTFDKKDMARLRSHVKALTGGKDLSPADTTTIEITLTTLTTLDKVMHTLRHKSHRLHLLAQRALWEAEYAKTMAWLHSTENEVDTFLGQARWNADDSFTTEDKAGLIGGLLALEQKLAAFDQGGFTTTVNLFQDLDDDAHEDLPQHLEQRQENCEQFFADLYKRMTFVRSVVEQRLAITDFLDSAHHVHVDAQQLQLDLQHAGPLVTEADVEPDDEDFWAESVQAVQERIVPLASSQRIPYPVATLMVDQQDNEAANSVIRQHVSHHRTQLVLLGEAVDGQWQSLKHRWQLRQRMLTMVAEAEQWAVWAEERTGVIQQNQQQLLQPAAGTETIALEQLAHWERTVEAMKTKVNSKETQIKGWHVRLERLQAAVIEAMKEITIPEGDDDEATTAATAELDTAVDDMGAAYARLKELIQTHEAALAQERQRLEQGHCAVDRRNELLQFIHSLRSSLPGLKHTCGFMTGQSQQQDQDRFDTLTSTLDRLTLAVDEKQALLAPFQLDNDLVGDWATLMDELTQLGVFKETVREWYDRQRRLSLVEQALATMATTLDVGGPVDEERILLIQDQQDTLAGIGHDIRQAADTRDPLQTANYSCARDRHQGLEARVQQMMTEAVAKQQQKQDLEAWRQYEEKVNQLVMAISADHATVQHRVAHHRTQVWEHRHADVLATLARATATETQRLDAQVQADHRTQWDTLRQHAPSSSSHIDNSTSDLDVRVQTALRQLDEATAMEKRQLISMRHLHVHAKAAQDLQQWLTQCMAALAQLTMEIGVVDESEVRSSIGRFEAKLENMQPSLAGFRRIEAKVRALLDDSDDGGVVPPSVAARDQARAHINNIGSSLDDGFRQVAIQLDELSSATDRHRHHVTIARKMKELLHMIGGYRDNVAAIRIPAHAPLGIDHNNNDDTGDDISVATNKEELQQQQPGVGVDCLSSWLMTCPLSMVPSEQSLGQAHTELDKLEQDIQLHLDGALDDLDQLIGVEQANAMFTDQRKEITQAIAGLTQGIQEKRHWLAEATQLESILTVLDEWEVLLSALSEVVDRASIPCSPSSSSSVTAAEAESNHDNPQQQKKKKRADLQAMLIDLDTRYRYYEPNIQALVKEAQLVMMMQVDDGEVQPQQKQQQDPRVVAYYNRLTDQWGQLQQLAKAKKQALIAKIGPLADPLMMSTLHDALPGGHQRFLQQQQQQQQHQQQQRRPMTTMSSITTTTRAATTPGPAKDRSCARKSSYQNLVQRQRPGRIVTPSPTAVLPPRLMTAERARKRSSWRENQPPSLPSATGASPMARRSMSPLDAYVPDPKNDLDVALGNIVNDSPYAIKVKMVPGEVGRYWFGKKNPKLAYCRILRSRMVMVRVGGGKKGKNRPGLGYDYVLIFFYRSGWVELSQFLRDHALLEDGRFTSTMEQRLAAATTTTTTTTTVGQNDQDLELKKKKRHSHPMMTSTAPKDEESVAASNESSQPTKTAPSLRHSKSTPFFQPSAYYFARGPSPHSPQFGIKEGNKFLVTDDDGKQVQVTMTKARSKQTSTFRTPWR